MKLKKVFALQRILKLLSGIDTGVGIVAYLE
jgi:hypothetical protein